MGNIFDMKLCEIKSFKENKKRESINRTSNIPFEKKDGRLENPSLLIAKRYLLEDLYNFPKISKRRLKYSNERIAQYVLHAADIAGLKILNAKELSQGSVKSGVIYLNRYGKAVKTSYNSFIHTAINNGFKRHSSGELWNYKVKENLPNYDSVEHMKKFNTEKIVERYNEIFKIIDDYKLIEVINKNGRLMDSSCIAINSKGEKRQYPYGSINALLWHRNNKNTISSFKPTKLEDRLDSKMKKLIDLIKDEDKVVRKHKRICAIMGCKYIETTLKDAYMKNTKLKIQKSNGKIIEVLYGSIYNRVLKGNLTVSCIKIY